MKLRAIQAYDLDDFQYEGETRKRVREVTAKLDLGFTATTPRQMGTQPIALARQLGGYDVRPHNTERGHLVPLEIGGPEDDRNQVPMWGHFNKHGAWKAFETELKAVTTRAYDGIDLTIGCEYSGAEDSRIPIGFEIEARWVDPIEGKSGGYRRKKVWRLSHPRPQPKIQLEHRWGVALVKEALAEMQRIGWTLEMSFPETATYQKTAVPGEDVPRPYAVLDFMAVSGLLDFNMRREVDNQKTFSDEQREAVLQVNRIFNHGHLISDNPDDFAHRLDEFTAYRVADHPAGTLMTEGGDQAPEVDHIIPRSMGGSNAFSNAQVVSRAYNNWKRSKIEEGERAVLLANRRIQPARVASTL